MKSCCLVLVFLGAAEAAVQIPPVMTTTQIKVFADNAERAEAASNAALPAVLAALGSAEVRDRLDPALATLSALELWNKYAAEVELAEISHGFPAVNDPMQNNALDLDIDIALDAPWFYNQWQMPLIFKQREVASYYELISYLAPAAALETAIWKFPNFTAPVPFEKGIWPGGYPADLSEASDRVVYGVFNQHKLDFPNFLWGNVAAVFNNSYVRPMTLLTSIDSGDWTCGCDIAFTAHFCTSWTNQSACSHFWYCNWENTSNTCQPSAYSVSEEQQDERGVLGGAEEKPRQLQAQQLSRQQHPQLSQQPPPQQQPHQPRQRRRQRHSVAGKAPDPEHNCTAFGALPTGTLDHHAHLLLPYANWYAPPVAPPHAAAERLATLLNRILQPWKTVSNMTTYNLFDFYYEADMAGNPSFPNAIQFVIAQFRDLFGTALGNKVQAWCNKWGWSLVWTLGPTYPSDARPNPQVHGIGANQNRLIDPVAKGKGLNATAAAGVSAAWNALWDKAVKARGASDASYSNGSRSDSASRVGRVGSAGSAGSAGAGASAGADAHGVNSTPPSDATINEWWVDAKVAVGPGMVVQPIRANVCANPDQCIGLTYDTQECLCYH